MTPNTFSVRIVVRTNRADKENYAPVYAKVTINNEVILLSLNRKISILDWLKNTESVKASNSHNKEVNTAIEALKTRIYQAHAQILAINKILNAENFKEAFYGETDTVLNTAMVATRITRPH
jgi:integrase/recombinase XerD